MDLTERLKQVFGWMTLVPNALLIGNSDQVGIRIIVGLSCHFHVLQIINPIIDVQHIRAFAVKVVIWNEVKHIVFVPE